MLNSIKSFLRFILIAVIFIILILVNYLNDQAVSLFPGLSPQAILGFSMACVLLVVFLFWRNEREVEKERYELVSIVTHKFRTPLTGIKWAVNMLSDEVTLEKKDDILKRVHTSVDRLVEIVDLLVNFSKIDSRLEFAYVATSFREIIETSMAKFGPLIKEKNIHFSVDADQNIPLIIIDKQKIQFVVDMIIENALQYTPAGGTVSVAIVSKGGLIELMVQDSGIGMTITEKFHLFKKFWRGSRARLAYTEGMGLGLYTARLIVKGHGGSLRGTSKGKDKGSTFFLTLKSGKNYTA